MDDEVVVEGVVVVVEEVVDDDVEDAEAVEDVVIGSGFSVVVVTDDSEVEDEAIVVVVEVVVNDTVVDSEDEVVVVVSRVDINSGSLSPLPSMDFSKFTRRTSSESLMLSVFVISSKTGERILRTPFSGFSVFILVAVTPRVINSSVLVGAVEF